MEKIKIAVLGLGLMGGSIAQAFKKFITDAEVYGYDIEKVVDKAIELNYIDIPIKNIEELPEDLDIMFLGAPIGINLELMKKVVSVKKWNKLLITDLGSTKTSIIKLIEELPENNWSFVGGHPMTGSEKRGIEASNSYLFENAVYVLTPSKLKTPEQSQMSLLIDILYKIGARIIKLEPELHDRLVAHISHLPYIIAVSLVNFLDEEEKSTLFYQLASGGYRGLTRIAQSPESIWEDVINDNKENVIEAIEHFINHLENLKKDIENNNFISKLIRAQNLRIKIPSDTKGFMAPLVDIIVEIQDKPGILADITTTLANEGINIKDMTILKIRENLGGVLQLSFDNKKDAFKASESLRQKNYIVLPQI